MSQNTKDTKQQILEASLDLFAAKGFSGTSMREIAQRVEIRKSSIYNHFSSKDDLIEILMGSLGPSVIFDTFKNTLDIDKIDDPYEVLKSFGESLYKLIIKPEEQKFMRLLLREHNNKIVRDILKVHLYNNKRIFLADVFKEMMDKDMIKKGDPVVYANEFTGPLVFFRLVDLLFIYDDEKFEKLKEYIDNHIDFFWSAIKK